jgi:hypothetical protein
MSASWPLVVGYLLDTLPALPGWSGVSVFDTDPVTAAAPATYAVVARTTDSSTSGNYSRAIAPSGLVSEAGAVRVHIVTRAGSVTPLQVRADGFTLANALESKILGDHSLDGVLGEAGTVSVATDVQSFADANGVGQALVVSINYTSLT